MKNLKTIAAGLCVATLVSSCATNQQTYGAAGGGAGAVLGGIVGNVIGKNTKGTMIGAAIGAAVGAGTGAIIGRHMDKVKQQTQSQVDNAKIEQLKMLTVSIVLRLLSTLESSSHSTVLPSMLLQKVT